MAGKQSAQLERKKFFADPIMVSMIVVLLVFLALFIPVSYTHLESKDMIKAGIIGSTGYAGGELARLLLQRDDVEIKWYGSRSYIDQKYASIYQNMFKIVDDKCMDDNRCV